MKNLGPTADESTKEETPSTAADSVGWTVSQKAKKAEIIATMQFGANNVPFSQADNLAACYQEQFPDSEIAQQVAISKNKMSYLIGYGLGPYFIQQTVKELVDGNSYFTLQFDETVSAQTKKHMDLLIRYWSKTSNEVKVISYITDVWICNSFYCCEGHHICT